MMVKNAEYTGINGKRIQLFHQVKIKLGHHSMPAGGLDPTHLVVKIGYQGIRRYVPATDPSLRREEKLKESRYSTEVRNIEYLGI